MTGDSVAFDRFLELCSDRHRRVVVAVLAGQRRTLTLQDLTKAVVRHGHHRAPEDAPGDVLEREQLSLYHCHVPALADAGLVDFDTTRHLVEPTERLHEWQSLLSTLLDADPALESPVEL